MIAGFFITAPVGPIGSLCIDRTLANGERSGFISGLGAVTADGFYSAVAAYGLTMISDFIISQQLWFRLAGGVFLFYLGIKIFFSRPRRKGALKNNNNLAVDYISAFFLAFANPLALLAFAAIFTFLGLGSSEGGYFSAALMVTGVILGSSLCWFALCRGVSVARNKFQAATLQSVHRIFGSILLIFSLIAMAAVLNNTGTILDAIGHLSRK